MRRAKIVAHPGPMSSSVEMIGNLIREGMNVARINMSHGTHKEHAETIKNIRTASEALGWEVAVLLDLQGPKIRVDKLSASLELKKGETWVIGPTAHKSDYPEYSKNFIPTIYENLVKDCVDGTPILFDDGKIVAKAVKRDREVYKIEILEGGTLKSNKGINLPEVDVSAPSFTDKDKKDLMFGLSNDVDYVALSFVRKKEDVLEVKYLLHKLKKNIPIVAKIEKPQALKNLDSILEVTDVIMVARGDMGVEIGNHLVPSVQKKIIASCNSRGVPVITATQMLESMIETSTPTRAEASDVANAIWDGTDAVMLSAETASGKFPIEAVRIMGKIIAEAEKTPREPPSLRNIDLSNVNASIMVAASMIAEKVEAKRILSVTESGNSCLRIGQFRPKTPVLGVTRSMQAVRRMCLYWGVSPFLLKDYDEDNFNLQKDLIKKVRDDLHLQNGDKVVITRGDGKFFAQGSSNSVKVEIIKDKPKVPGSSEGLVTSEFSRGTIHFDTNICGSCNSCINVCPHDIWMTSEEQMNRTYINHGKAEQCAMDMACVEMCPTGAIEIIPKSS